MGNTTLDLYRSGNSGGAGLERVRTNGSNADVNVYLHQATGQEWVRADGQGASTWDTLDPSWRGKPWRLRSGAAYPDTLVLWNDDPGHWTWAPAADMPLADYQKALAVVSAKFVKV